MFSFRVTPSQPFYLNLDVYDSYFENFTFVILNTISFDK